jgi:hypothetical protein
MESEGPYRVVQPVDMIPLTVEGPTGNHGLMLQGGFLCNALNAAHTAGRKDERERNWKTVAELCGVNPAERRPCIEKVDRKFWCPVCLCADSIRGGQDGK